ncbi:MAG: universal stress protein [Wenzhouxiangellaceae bacterium]
MKTVLITTDFSQRSTIAIQRGAALAKAQDWSLTLAHAVDSDQPTQLADTLQQQASALLESQATALQDEYAIRVNHAVLRGDPAEEIATAAERLDVALIIIGSQRRNLLRNTFVGTTAERIIRLSPKPVLVARSIAEHYRKPVIALDLSENETSPLSAALELELFDSDAATVVFAFEANQFHLLRRAGSTRDELDNYLRTEKQRYQPKAEQIVTQHDMKAAQAVLVATQYNIADTILETAASHAADLLVVGSHRKRALQRLTLGSVSDVVLRQAGIDVLVVPPDPAD